MKRKWFLTMFLVISVIATLGAARIQQSFRATLTGDQEVPPVETDAHGLALYLFNLQETRMRFRVRVFKIEDVVAAHVHCAPPGVDGPVGITLFSGGPVSIESGVLAEGTVTAPDPGNACGWDDLSDAAEAMRSGNAYDNVHTLAHPGGEIRGNIMPSR